MRMLKYPGVERDVLHIFKLILWQFRFRKKTLFESAFIRKLKKKEKYLNESENKQNVKLMI